MYWKRTLILLLAATLYILIMVSVFHGPGPSQSHVSKTAPQETYHSETTTTTTTFEGATGGTQDYVRLTGKWEILYSLYNATNTSEFFARNFGTFTVYRVVEQSVGDVATFIGNREIVAGLIIANPSYVFCTRKEGNNYTVIATEYASSTPVTTFTLHLSPCRLPSTMYFSEYVSYTGFTVSVTGTYYADSDEVVEAGTSDGFSVTDGVYPIIIENPPIALGNSIVIAELDFTYGLIVYSGNFNGSYYEGTVFAPDADADALVSIGTFRFYYSPMAPSSG